MYSLNELYWSVIDLFKFNTIKAWENVALLKVGKALKNETISYSNEK